MQPYQYGQLVNEIARRMRGFCWLGTIHEDDNKGHLADAVPGLFRGWKRTRWVEDNLTASANLGVHANLGPTKCSLRNPQGEQIPLKVKGGCPRMREVGSSDESPASKRGSGKCWRMPRCNRRDVIQVSWDDHLREYVQNGLLMDFGPYGMLLFSTTYQVSAWELWLPRASGGLSTCSRAKRVTMRSSSWTKVARCYWSSTSVGKISLDQRFGKCSCGALALEGSML